MPKQRPDISIAELEKSGQFLSLNEGEQQRVRQQYLKELTEEPEWKDMSSGSRSELSGRILNLDIDSVGVIREEPSLIESFSVQLKRKAALGLKGGVRGLTLGEKEPFKDVKPSSRVETGVEVLSSIGGTVAPLLANEMLVQGTSSAIYSGASKLFPSLTKITPALTNISREAKALEATKSLFPNVPIQVIKGASKLQGNLADTTLNTLRGVRALAKTGALGYLLGFEHKPEKGKTRHQMGLEESAFFLAFPVVIGSGMWAVNRTPLRSMFNRPMSETLHNFFKFMTNEFKQDFSMVSKGTSAEAINSEVNLLARILYSAGRRTPEDIFKGTVLEPIVRFSYAVERQTNNILYRYGRRLETLYESITPDERRIVQMAERVSEGKLKHASVKALPEHLRRFIIERKRAFTDPLADMLGLEKGRRFGFYITHVFDKLKFSADETSEKTAFNLARAMGLPSKNANDFAKAIIEKKGEIEIEKALFGGIPRKAFFGPRLERITKSSGADMDLKVKDFLYLIGASKAVSTDRFLSASRETMAKIPRNTWVHDAGMQFIDSVRGASSNYGDFLESILRVESMRQFYSKIASTFAVAGINLTQSYVNTIPKLVSKRGLSGLDDFFRSSILQWTNEGRRISRMAGVHKDFLGKGDIEESSIKGLSEKILEFLSIHFAKSEQINRRRTGISEFLGASREGPLFKAIREAEKRINETQFNFSRAGRAPFLLTKFGRVTGKFSLYTTNQLQFIKNMTPNELMAFVGVLSLMGGTDIWSETPLAPKPIRYMRTRLNIEAPDAPLTKVMNTLQRHSLAGLSEIDLSGQLGLGFIPFGFSGAEKQHIGETLIDVFGGPSIGDIERVRKSLIGESDPRGTSVLLARWIRDNSLLAEPRIDPDGFLLDFKGRRIARINERDILKMRFGQTPESVAEERRMSSMVADDASAIKEFRKRFIESVFDNDRDGAQAVWDETMKRFGVPLYYSNRDLNSALQAESKNRLFTRIQRQFFRLPKPLKTRLKGVVVPP